MSMFENFPYTNLHNLNLDWIVKQITEQKDFLETGLIPLIEEKVQEVLINMAISYDPVTETLAFTINTEG